MNLFKTALALALSGALLFQVVPVQAASGCTAAQTAGAAVAPATDDPRVLGELESERDAYTKRFAMADGTVTAAQYVEPVHFRRDGEWVEYDNSLSEESEGGQAYLRNKTSDLETALSKKTNGNKLVRLKKDGYSMSWTFDGIKKADAEAVAREADNDATTLENLSSEVWYRGVYKDVDLQYILSSGYLKENIVLSSDGRTTFEANYRCPQLKPVLDSDGRTVRVENPDGETVFVINTPYMTDALGAASTDVTLELKNVKNGRFTLVTTLSSEWLSDPDRAFPVTVDPAFTTSQAWNAADACSSAFVAQGAPNSRFGRGGKNYEGSLYVGYEASGSRGAVRSYLKYDNLPQLGVCDQIVDARVNLLLYACYPSKTVYVHRVQSDWSASSISWNTQPSVDDYLKYDYKYIPIHDNKTSSPEWQSWEITSLVQEWYSGEKPNYGIALYASNESKGSGRAMFYSSGFPDAQALRPCITVTYRNMAGYEDYYSYTGMSVGDSGTLSVNNFNGNVVYTQPLTVDCGGSRLPVNISLVYNSNLTYGQGYSNVGRSAQTNFHIYIGKNNRINSSSSEPEKHCKYYINDADATQHYFYFENLTDTTAKDEDGLGYTLEVSEAVSETDMDAVRYTVTDKLGSRMRFNGYGQLKRIEDTSGNAITLDYSALSGYSPRIERITDGAGRVYTFGYYDHTPWVVHTITDPAGRVTRLNYAYDSLWTVDMPDGRSVGFYYTDKDAGSQWCTIYGNCLATRFEISYDPSAQHRATLVRELSGDDVVQSYSFAYKLKDTAVTDMQGRQLHYQFDDFGRCTGIVSSVSGQAQFFDYTPSGHLETANKLISSSKVRSSTVNYIKNPSVSRAVSDGYGFWFSDDLADNSAVERDGAVGHFSAGSAKVVKSSKSGYKYVQQAFELEAGWYTFSAYVKTDGAISGDGAMINAEVWDKTTPAGPEKTYLRSGISDTDGWKRCFVTAYLPEGKRLVLNFGFADGAAGTAWFDDLQLERGQGATAFNLLENSCFTEGDSHWSFTSQQHGSGSVIGRTEVPGIVTGAYMRNTDIKLDSNTSQTIAVSGKKGDVFSVGSWAGLVSAPTNNGTKDGTPYQPKFAMRIEYLDSSGAVVGSTDHDFNADYSAWQYADFKSVAAADYASVRVKLVFDHNVNNFYFTGVVCYKEEYGQTYTYDKNGNVVSSSDLAKTQSQFAYQGNQMTKLLNPSGSSYIYSYNGSGDSTTTLAAANSTDGQQYLFNYDSYGNVTSATVEQSALAGTLKANTSYVFRNAYSGNAMDMGDMGGYLDNNTKNYRFVRYSPYQFWQLVPTGEQDVWRIYAPTHGKYLQVRSDGEHLRLEADAPSNAAQKFKLLSNGDGTWRVLTAATNYAKCIDGQPGDSTATGDQSEIKQTDYVEGDFGQKWYIFVQANTSTATIETSAEYSSDGNMPSSTTDASGNTTLVTYDPGSGQLTSTTDPEGNKTEYSYENGSNRLTSVSIGSSKVGYTYNAFADLTEITQNDKVKYRFTYDSFGRMVKTELVSGDKAVALSTTTYDEYSRPTVSTYGNGAFLTRSYDVLGNVTEVVYGTDSTKSVRYFYGSDNALNAVVDGIAGTTTQYTYDLAGRVVGVSVYKTTDTLYTPDKVASELEYTYADRTDYLTEIKQYTPELGRHSIKYTYGDLSRGEMPDCVYAVSLDGVEKQRYDYDGLGRLVTSSVITKSGAMSSSYSYESGKKSGTTTTRVSTFVTDLGAYEYTYDKNGNITREKFTSFVSGVANYERSYDYDKLGQLRYYFDGRETYIYDIDSSGNITSRYTIETSTTDSYTYDGDVLTSYNGKAITSDAIGNPLNYMGLTMTWEYGRKLTAISGSGLSAVYAYAADGKRLSKTVNGVTTDFIYSGDTLAGFKRGNDTLMWLYGADGDYLGFTLNGAEYYYVKNMQGDVVAIADENRNIVVVYTYNDYGKIESVSGSLADTVGALNPIRYRGYYYDDETGFYYTDTRYYDPQTARFINADDESLIIATPMSLTDKNLYAYCDNNPISRADRDGQFWNVVIGAAAGAVVGGVMAAITGSDITTGVLSGAVSGALSGLGLGGAALVKSTLLRGVFCVSGGLLGGLAGSWIDQKRNTGKVDIGTLICDALYGAMGGLVSFGIGSIGGFTNFKEILKKPAATIAKQAVTDFTSSAYTAAGASAGSTLTKNEHEGRCASKTVSSPARPPVVRRTGYYYNSYRYRRGAQQ